MTDTTVPYCMAAWSLYVVTSYKEAISGACLCQISLCFWSYVQLQFTSIGLQFLHCLCGPNGQLESLTWKAPSSGKIYFEFHIRNRLYYVALKPQGGKKTQFYKIYKQTYLCIPLRRVKVAFTFPRLLHVHQNRFSSSNNEWEWNSWLHFGSVTPVCELTQLLEPTQSVHVSSTYLYYTQS